MAQQFIFFLRTLFARVSGRLQYMPGQAGAPAAIRVIKTRIRLQATMTLAAILFLTATPQHAVAGEFKPPSLEGYNLHDERDADGDGDDINETHIRQYLNTAGDSIVSMSSGERIWAWSLDKRNSETGESNYVIRDSDCDGQFDELFGLNDEFHVPTCVK